ncbi:hypothetical protein ACFX13_033955 [Malus domestica]
MHEGCEGQVVVASEKDVLLIRFLGRSGHAKSLMSYKTFTSVSAKGRPLMTTLWALRTLAAATSLMASMIFWVFFMESIQTQSLCKLQRVVED